VKLSEIRAPQLNATHDNAALARMLWKNEAIRSLRRDGHKEVTYKNSAEEIWAAAAKLLRTEALASEVRSAIKARGGSGFAKRSVQDGGSCTTESIAPLAHYSENLAWLLSQISPNPPD
jgi:hypothetical protein